MTYRIRNWSDYNAALKQRGSLSFWIEESVLEQWIVKDLSGKRGASTFYSDLAITTIATLKAIYRLPGRQCLGFVESIFELMGIDLPVPDHSTLSRRLGRLPQPLRQGHAGRVPQGAAEDAGPAARGSGRQRRHRRLIRQ